ncbi:MAG: CcoQ/FixQ family Cbb3-type cytochrome c oxidase assembly chaperone [Rubrivivax sp.]|nr:CcoQ/FixQ family Cbb3-type cytochrome c oxidase assembly chaperone [Rubrivivax sp.]
MDINHLRAGVTLLGLVVFLGLVVWAWSGRRKSGFDEAARLPFDGEVEVVETAERQS